MLAVGEKGVVPPSVPFLAVNQGLTSPWARNYGTVCICSSFCHVAYLSASLLGGPLTDVCLHDWAPLQNPPCVAYKEVQRGERKSCSVLNPPVSLCRECASQPFF